MMENESVDGGSRVGLDNASRVSDLHRGGDSPVDPIYTIQYLHQQCI